MRKLFAFRRSTYALPDLEAILLTQHRSEASMGPQHLSLSANAIARRTDLALRARYPHLKTRIFEVGTNAQVIFFEGEQLDAQSISQHFETYIRPVTAQITLSNSLPKNYTKELSPISDQDITNKFEGLQFSIIDIQNVLLAKYPELPSFHGGRRSSQNVAIQLIFEGALNEVQEQTVRGFMDGMLPGWPVEISMGPPEQVSDRVKSTLGENLAIRPSRLRSRQVAFIREDEAFWFENMDALFRNGVHANSFPATANAGAACYIDASAFPQIDIRQAVLLYDTIYLTPPIVERDASQPSFWDKQVLNRDDVLGLIEKGRLRLVLSQPEERTDLSFLQAAYERNPVGVIGRRTAAAILISDIVQTAEEYKLASPELASDVGILAREISDHAKASFESTVRFLLWPVHARRACLAPLLNSGLMGISAFSQGRILADQLQALTGKDYLLEADLTSHGVHVAHALNATLIPSLEEMGGWIAPRQAVGERLNFYRSFNSRIAPAWVGNERRKEQRQRVLPPLPLFEFERHAPLKDLVQATSRPSTRQMGRGLVTRLSNMPPEEREDELSKIAKEFYELGAKKERRSAEVDFVSDTIDVGAAIMSASLTPVRPIWNFMHRALDIARRKPGLDRVVFAIEQDLRENIGHNTDMEFLSKVSRVARLK